MNATKESIETVAAELGLTMHAVFVPWSKSRNAGEKQPSLNWLVTLRKDGRDVLTTDYMAGNGHCPSYKASVKELGHGDSIMRTDAIKQECETGRERSAMHSAKAGRPLLPVFADVLHSLASDSDVIDCATFEEWAENYGMDTDSRKAEATYRACLEIALKLRNGLGEAGLKTLREAVQDY